MIHIHAVLRASLTKLTPQVVSAKPGTFELTFWNKYDYVWLLLYLVGFLLRITPDGFLAPGSMHLRRSNDAPRIP